MTGRKRAIGGSSGTGESRRDRVERALERHLGRHELPAGGRDALPVAVAVEIAPDDGGHLADLGADEMLTGDEGVGPVHRLGDDKAAVGEAENEAEPGELA